MPSPVGHALGGIAVAWALDPTADRKLTAVCAALAVAPDLDLLLPVAHRAVTHSIGAVAFVAVFAAAIAVESRRPIAKLALMCAAAYGSHLLLDWLGADHSAPEGIRALWPFSHRYYISHLDVFRETVRRFITTAPVMVQNAKAVMQEIAILGPIVVALWLVRVKALAGLAAEMSRGHHPAQ